MIMRTVVKFIQAVNHCCLDSTHYESPSCSWGCFELPQKIPPNLWHNPAGCVMHQLLQAMCHLGVIWTWVCVMHLATGVLLYASLTQVSCGCPGVLLYVPQTHVSCGCPGVLLYVPQTHVSCGCPGVLLYAPQTQVSCGCPGVLLYAPQTQVSCGCPGVLLYVPQTQGCSVFDLIHVSCPVLSCPVLSCPVLSCPDIVLLLQWARRPRRSCQRMARCRRVRRSD